MTSAVASLLPTLALGVVAVSAWPAWVAAAGPFLVFLPGGLSALALLLGFRLALAPLAKALGLLAGPRARKTVKGRAAREDAFPWTSRASPTSAPSTRASCERRASRPSPSSPR